MSLDKNEYVKQVKRYNKNKRTVYIKYTRLCTIVKTLIDKI